MVNTHQAWQQILYLFSLSLSLSLSLAVKTQIIYAQSLHAHTHTHTHTLSLVVKNQITYSPKYWGGFSPKALWVLPPMAHIHTCTLVALVFSLVKPSLCQLPWLAGNWRLIIQSSCCIPRGELGCNIWQKAWQIIPCDHRKRKKLCYFLVLLSVVLYTYI